MMGSSEYYSLIGKEMPMQAVSNDITLQNIKDIRAAITKSSDTGITSNNLIHDSSWVYRD